MRDDRYEELEARSRRAADETWRRALERGEDVDAHIEKARVRGEEAYRRSDPEMCFFWGNVEYILDQGQRLRDVLLSERQERFDNLNEVWPKNYAEQLDASGGGMEW